MEVMKHLIVAATIVSLGIIVLINMQVLLASPERFYAGYYYYGSEGYPPPNGIKGDIYTIDKSVPEGNFYCQWVTVILRYRPLYWIQIGYSKAPSTQYRVRSYTEKWDANGYDIQYFSFRSSDVTYNYWISKDSSSGIWTCGSEDWSYYLGVLNPNSARDYQAFSETTNTAINIDGTHFMNLCYKLGNDWQFWDRHVKRQDSPYWVSEVSHYEFYAGGGG